MGTWRYTDKGLVRGWVEEILRRRGREGAMEKKINPIRGEEKAEREVKSKAGCQMITKTGWKGG